jgi:hypothetical protein
VSVASEKNRAAMLQRLDRYAELRAADVRPMDAAAEVGVSKRTAEGYERWYRRERLHLADRPPVFPVRESLWQ